MKVAGCNKKRLRMKSQSMGIALSVCRSSTALCLPPVCPPSPFCNLHAALRFTCSFVPLMTNPSLSILSVVFSSLPLSVPSAMCRAFANVVFLQYPNSEDQYKKQLLLSLVRLFRNSLNNRCVRAFVGHACGACICVSVCVCLCQLALCSSEMHPVTSILFARPPYQLTLNIL